MVSHLVAKVIVTVVTTNFYPQIDPLAAGMASLSLGGSAAPHTQSMPGFPPNLSSAFSTPQSPAKAFPPLSTQNQNTPFSGIGGLSSQLPVGGLTTGSLGIGTGALGLPAVNNDSFVPRKLSTSGLSQPAFQQSKMKPSDLSQVWPEANQHFSKEIDDEANSYFQRIYNHPPHPTMSVDEVLEMLQRFKDSNIKREREVFNCMLRNLFEEYRFFPQYPDKELHITACLFGGIIEKGLVTYMALGLALRYVLEALRKPFPSKMYYFGIAALDRFKNRCEWGAGVLNLVLSLSLSRTGHWKFNMAPRGKELSEDLKKRIVALHKDGLGYKKIAKTLKLSCSTVAKTIQRLNRTGSTQNRPRHGRPKKWSARAQRHIQRLPLGNRRMSAASIAAGVAGVEGQPVSAQTVRRTLHQIGLQGCCPRRKPRLKMMHKKARKQLAEDKQTKEMDYWNHVLWSDETKINLVQMVSSVCGDNQARSTKTNSFTIDRLKDYPQYCQHLASISHFIQFPHHLQEYIEYGQQSRDPPVKMQGSITTPGSIALAQAQAQAQVPSKAPLAGQVSTIATTSTTTTTVAKTTITPVGRVSFKKDVPPSINTTNIDTLLVATDQTERIVEPPENVQEKIAFIFNNLSQSNMTQKASPVRPGSWSDWLSVEELKETVKEEFMPWVSQYLVMKRVSIEPNFHSLYSNFLDTLKNPEFNKMVLNETYRNIKVLLTSDKAAANFSDRSLLKNLGHWLGMITLAKNKPILHTDLDVKSLLLEAYVKGQQELLYVVPFVAKVLESSVRSVVFRPPNPWTMAIMNVLAELHQEHDLKLNLKFEIEVLCKNLALDINELKPGNLLKDKDRLKNLDEQLSAPKKDVKQPEELPPITTTTASTTPATSTTCTATVPPQPQYSYHDINVYSLGGLAPHITLNPSIPLFQAHPQLKQCVRQAIDRAVQELVHPVVDRSIKIAMTTCEQIVRKDFALDSEESRMRVAAHHMMRNLTAGMAMITCREPLLVSIATNLKNSFATVLRAASPQQRDMMEQAAAQLAQDNCELACCFIQKTAVEKAGPEMDKRLATEFELRKHARQEGRRYCDPVVLTYQAERMPEQIRLKVGGVDPKQLAVYEEFARNVPGFLPTNDSTQPTGILAQPMKQAWATDDVAQIYDKCMAELEQHLQSIPHALAMNPQAQALRSLLEAVVVARNSRDAIAALGLLQKAVEGLLDATSGADADLLLRYRECHLLVLKALQDGRAYGSPWCNKQITRCLIECRDEYKYNVEAVELLIRNHLVNMQQYDLHLAQSMENGLNYMAVAFAMQLVKILLVDERSVAHITEADLFHTIETLMRINAHSRGNAPEGLPQLMEVVRSNYEAMIDRAHGGPNFMMHSGISQASEYDDPPGLREKAEYLLREWVNLYHSAAAGRDSTKAFSAFVGQMHQQGILKTDDLITRFFRLCTEMCVEISYRAQAEQQHNPAANPTMIRAKCYHNLDAFVRLIALLVKHSGEATNTVTKINLLNKVLGIVVGVLLQDHDVRQSEFQQLPYHRIFIMLLLELNAPEHVLETINFQTLTAFCNTFHILRPTKAPGFVYAWLELISHRIFIARMLAHTPQQKGWPMYAQLLIDLFKYLAPFLRNVELAKPMQILYKGTLRVLLVLLHDFPEFLCDYHYGFCDVIPPNCIQLRNLILSAFPRNMRLPDPFTPNLKVDMLSEINIAPRILTNFTGVMPPQFKKDLDSYLKTRSPVTFLSELRSNLQATGKLLALARRSWKSEQTSSVSSAHPDASCSASPPQVSNEPGNRYNIQLINALVLYVGTQAIAHIHNKGSTPSMSTITHSAHMDIFQNLAVDLDTEGRYLFLNAIANQLRYPNSHTHYFSCTMLYLFAEANTEAIQEQITRVLLERLIVNRPHPWGLLITFIELIKNPAFKFWNHEFVHCAPEIEKLFQSVAQCCMGQKQAQQVMEGTGAS
ncbi:CCR4-NOT transcription complex subunit 1 [Varanus komodoensis]|nr:CCR4-NOT transcription complex subunit 1 [Varanus komodoensis]